jgi:predicted dehydrogenase
VLPDSQARVALIGYGLAGKVFHAPLIASVHGLALAAIVTRDPGRQAEARREHPDAVLLETAQEVWERADDFDLVVVAAPNRAHAPLARASLEAGLPVVVDKPLAINAGEARELVDEARRRGLMLTVFHNRRWDGDLLTARRLIEHGEVGRVLRFESRFERWRPAVSAGWREQPGLDEGGGLLYDLGSHLVDQALHLFGPVSQVYAEVDSRRAGAQVDDDVFVALRHRSRVRSHLWMSAVAAELGPRLRVLGDRAAYVKYRLDGQEDALAAGGRPDHPDWGQEPEEDWGLLGVDGDTRRVPTEPGAYQRFYEGVAAALHQGGEPPVDPEQAVSVLLVLDAARVSAQEGRVLALGEETVAPS